MFRDNVFSKLPPEGFCLVKVVVSCFVLSCLATLRARLLKILFLYFAKLSQTSHQFKDVRQKNLVLVWRVLRTPCLEFSRQRHKLPETQNEASKR